MGAADNVKKNLKQGQRKLVSAINIVLNILHPIYFFFIFVNSF